MDGRNEKSGRYFKVDDWISYVLKLITYRALVGTRVRFGRTNVGHLSLIIAEFELEDFFELPEDLEPADILRFFGFGVISNVSNLPLFET